MKKITRILSLVVALALVVMSVSVTAVSTAADETTYTLTINNANSSNENETHNYTAYQIFTGTPSSDASTLSDITGFGSDVAASTLITALQALNTDADNPTYTAIASLTSESTAAAVAAAITSDGLSAEQIITVLATDGVITGSGTSVSYNNTSGTYTAELAGGYYYITDSGVETAGTILTIVGDTTLTTKSTDNASIEKTVNGNTETYDYGNGDDVPFTITVTLPSAITAYTEYYVSIADTLTGLTYNGDAVVTLTLSDESTSYVLYIADSSDTTALGVGSLSYDSDSNALTYTATLSNSSIDNVSLSDLADATITITYTAKVTSTSYDGATNDAELTYSNDPTDSSNHGTDTATTVYVYQYTLVINKTDSSTNDALEGADFSLTDNSNTDTSYEGETVSYSDSNGNALTDNSESKATTFTFSYLDAGTYTLSETATPDGYNSISNLTVVINTDGSVEINNEDATVTDGVITYTVENTAGAELPSTGGMGTKIFYTLGGILVVGAGVLLIVKRRMRTA